MTEQARVTRPAAAGEQQVEVAVLAGGCFWGVEDILREVPGVAGSSARHAIPWCN